MGKRVIIEPALCVKLAHYDYYYEWRAGYYHSYIEKNNEPDNYEVAADGLLLKLLIDKYLLDGRPAAVDEEEQSHYDPYTIVTIPVPKWLLTVPPLIC